MRQQAAALSEAQRAQIAEYLTGDAPDVARTSALPPLCRGAAAEFDRSAAPGAVGWGADLANTRFVPAPESRLAVADVPRLELAWAYRFPGALRARSQATAAYGALYVGSQDGTVYALDAKSGCLRWSHRVSAEVRTAIVVGSGASPMAYFGDLIGRVHAVDALTGAPRWTIRADDHPNTTITGSPVLHAGRLFVPLSSLEVTSAADPRYECCSFRGSILALDAATGATLWKRYAIDEQPREVGRSSLGTRLLAPSGAPIWSAPTLDLARGVLYAGTGENYSSPANARSDAVLALDLASGAIRWTWQAVARDAWNVGCMIPNESCPAENGPDFDLGAGTVLVGDRLAIGQKSGEVLALSTDGTGRVLWRKRLGRGSIQGGVHWGLATDGKALFVPINDMDARDGRTYAGAPRPGLYGVDLASGELLWSAPADDVCRGREFCDPGISAAVTAIPGVVFAGHLDGRLRAYDASNGTVLWQYDTTREVETVTGERAAGGSISGPGPTVHDGMVYVSSGYGLYYHMPGGLLLAFRVKPGP
jgi:polyvinyl alcohol dehydrogenase (cytochrome)